MATYKGDVRSLSISLFILLSVSIILGLYFRQPWLWMDEVLSYVLISDPSLLHLNASLISNMDANPPLFPNLYWLIGHIFSLDPFFLRTISILLFTSTIGGFFWHTTSLTGKPVVNFILISSMIYFTYQNFAHSTQIRSYAVLLPISWGYFICVHQLITRHTLRLLVLQILLGCLMVFCHNYGLFYLAAASAFFLFLWYWSKQPVYLVIVSSQVLIGLIWLITWYPSFTIQSDAGKPHSWIPLPTLTSFFYAVGSLIPSLSDRLENRPSLAWLPGVRVGLLLLLNIYLLRGRLKAGFQAFYQDKAFQFFFLSGFITLFTICIALSVSLTYTSVFLSRYMWPSQLLIMFQLVYAYNYIVERRFPIPNLDKIQPLYSILLGSVIFYKVWKMHLPFPSTILSYLPQLNNQFPVFVERADYFLPIWYHKRHPNITFLLDWKLANRLGNIQSATVDYKILQSVRENYMVSGIVQREVFTVRHYTRFYVIDEQAVYQMEDFIKKGQIKVIREIPMTITGHRLLECTF